MKLKKIIRYLLKTLFVLFVILFAYFGSMPTKRKSSKTLMQISIKPLR